MWKLFSTLGVALLVASAATGDKDTGPGVAVPEFNALKWYNTVPLTLEDLKGKAVLLQVFRTW